MEDSLESDNKYEKSSVNLLVACTGSVATIKLPILLAELLSKIQDDYLKLNIKVISTKNALHFFKQEDLPSCVEVLTDEVEWQTWQGRGDSVVHIDLAKWADLMVIAPLDANTLAKMATGLCDNLLTCVARAWIFSKPVIFCPAMNTRMWEHPITSKHINKLKLWGMTEIPCIEKTLVCGDTGIGAMANVDTIVEHVKTLIDINLPVRPSKALLT